jgi:hypothetical protein
MCRSGSCGAITATGERTREVLDAGASGRSRPAARKSDHRPGGTLQLQRLTLRSPHWGRPGKAMAAYQAISELSAFESPVRPLMVTVILVHSVLLLAFGVGVLYASRRKASRGRRPPDRDLHRRIPYAHGLGDEFARYGAGVQTTRCTSYGRRCSACFLLASAVSVVPVYRRPRASD